MHKYFNVFLEFDRTKLNAIVEKTITEKGKGYVCVVDGNVLAIATRDETYRTIINNALVSACDGNSIALMINKIHKKKYNAYTGPEIFNYFIRKGYRQYFLGNTEDILNKLLYSFKTENIDTNSMQFLTLPFLKVDDFDYSGIGMVINECKPQLIWISLGAPKQEIFISKLLPHVNTGVMFAIGAAFNLYLDRDNSRLNVWLKNLHLGWVLRVLKEPRRIGFRAWNYLVIIPKLIKEEKKIQSQPDNEATGSKC
jgi:N-acetylglucosaminyldiphosphoundecaprenol N-acetyl-beta-D-mannosaminyltransferase